MSKILKRTEANVENLKAIVSAHQFATGKPLYPTDALALSGFSMKEVIECMESLKAEVARLTMELDCVAEDTFKAALRTIEELKIRAESAEAALKEQEITINLRSAAMEDIEKAAAESPWVPSDYYMNEVVSDCCDFLRNERSVDWDEILEQAAWAGYTECAKVRHVTLGDAVAAAIRGLKNDTRQSRTPSYAC